MRCVLAFVLVLTAASIPWAQAERPKAGEMVNNPPYAHWAQFAVGTSVTVKEVVTLANGSVVESLTTSKLVAKGKDKLAVETTVAAADAAKQDAAVEATKTVTVYPARVKFEGTHSQPDTGYSVTEGKELVDVKGKQVESEWVEATATHGDETVVEKMWTAQDVPGGVVKQTITKKKGDKVQSQSALELVKFTPKPETKAPAKAPAKK